MDIFTSIYSILPPRLADLFKKIPPVIVQQITEVRIRMQRPLIAVLGNQDIFIGLEGEITENQQLAYQCGAEDLAQLVQLISKNSLYACEQELRSGYFTITGGHRVGVAGQAIMENGRLKALKNISSVNLRIAREVAGCADAILPYLIDRERLMSSLIISPPRCGKTTILRDIVRQISDGIPSIPCKGVQVGIVDERSEIAACQQGVPTMNIGCRTDVLDGCPKAIGMLMLIRSMSPAIIITDELGREEDATAVREALHAGIAVITTVHGDNEIDVARRPYIGELIRERFFDRYIILANKPRIGTLKKVIEAKEDTVLYSREKRDVHVVKASR